MMMKKTYHDLERHYQKLSNENTRRLRASNDPERYERARRREVLIQKAFFSDCRKYLSEDDF